MRRAPLLRVGPPNAHGDVPLVFRSASDRSRSPLPAKLVPADLCSIGEGNDRHAHPMSTSGAAAVTGRFYQIS